MGTRGSFFLRMIPFPFSLAFLPPGITRRSVFASRKEESGFWRKFYLYFHVRKSRVFGSNKGREERFLCIYPFLHERELILLKVTFFNSGKIFLFFLSKLHDSDSFSFAGVSFFFFLENYTGFSWSENFFSWKEEVGSWIGGIVLIWKTLVKGNCKILQICIFVVWFWWCFVAGVDLFSTGMKM